MLRWNPAATDARGLPDLDSAGNMPLRRRGGALAFGLVLAFGAVAVFPSPVAAASRDWSTSLPGMSYTSIVLRNSYVYLGTDDGVLYVLGMRDGRRRWTYSVRPSGPVAPVVAQGKVWLATGDGSIHAVNAFTGKRLWVYRPTGGLPAPTKPSEFTGPALVAGRLVQREKTQLVSIVASTGHRVRTLDLPIGHITYPGAIPGAAVIGVHKDLYALSPDLGAIRWAARLGEEGPVTPALVGGVLVTGTRSGRVFAVDITRGHVIWRYDKLPAAATVVSGESDVVFAATATGSIYAFDLASGRLLWRFDTGGSMVSKPVVSGGSVLFGSNDGRLYSVSLEGGRFEWSFDTQDEFVSSLAVDQNVAYMAVNAYRSGTSVTRVLALDVDRMLSGLHAFGRDARISGRMAEHDNVSTVLVDSAVVAADRVAPEGGLWGALAWPYRYPAAAGNPNAAIREPGTAGSTRTAPWADDAALAAGVLGITAGPASLAVFLFAFVLSAVGFALWPRSVPVLGGVSAAEADRARSAQDDIGRAIRQVASSRWMLAVAYGVEAAAATVLVGLRLVAGPANEAGLFAMWAAAAWFVAVLGSAVCRIVLLRGAAQLRGGGWPTMRGCRPRGQTLVRVLLLYVAIWLVAGTVFALVDLAGALRAGWLLPVAVVLALGVFPLSLADTYLAVDEVTIPRSLLGAVKLLGGQWRSSAGYFGLVLAAQLGIAAVGASAGGGWGLVAALSICPLVSCVLAGLSVRMLAKKQPSTCFTGPQ